MRSGRPGLTAVGVAAAALAAAATLVIQPLGAGASSGSLQPGTLRVAVIEPTGGPFGEHNKALANGAVLAADQINAAGGIGKKVKLELTRVPLSLSASASAVVDGVASRGIRIVVLPCNVNAASQLATAAAQRGMLILNPCQADSSKKLLAREWPVGMAGNAQAAQLANWASTHNGTRVFILSSNGPAYISVMTRNLRRAARLYKLDIVGEGKIRLGDMKSVDALMPKINRLRPAVILTPVFSPYLLPLVSHVRTKGSLVSFLATDGADAGLKIGRYEPESLEALRFTTYGFPRPSAKTFLKTYRERFRRRATGSFPGLGFESVRVLSAAVLKARSTDPAALDRSMSRGLRVTGIALGDRTYLGRGVRRPIVDVGIAGVIRGQYRAFVEQRPLPVAPG